MNQRDDFLARRFAGGQGAGSAYRPVVRMEPIQDESVREDVRPVTAACPVDSWFRLLGRPWSWRWRWVLGLGVLACVALGVLSMAKPGLHRLYACAMAACVPVTAITLFCEMDATRRVTWWVAALVTVLGGLLSLFFAGFLWGWFGLVPTAALAGVVEEPAKGLVLLILAMFSRRFPGILSGLALGVCVGAGFAIFETIDYAYRFGEYGLPSTWVLVLRGALSPLMHLAWTGALGGAMWAARGPGRTGWAALGSWLTWAVLAGMVVMHCIWNTVGPVQWICLALWALIFRFAKRGAAQAAAWGFAPKGA